MARVHDMAEAIADLLGRPEATWLAMRLKLDDYESSDFWIERIDIPARFYCDIVEAVPGGVVIPVEVASHGLHGLAHVRLSGERRFIEWDLRGATTCPDGIWGALAILVLLRDQGTSRLWCWICDTIEETDNAELVFGYPPTAGFWYGGQSPISPELLTD